MHRNVWTKGVDRTKGVENPGTERNLIVGACKLELLSIKLQRALY